MCDEIYSHPGYERVNIDGLCYELRGKALLPLSGNAQELAQVPAMAAMR